SGIFPCCALTGTQSAQITAQKLKTVIVFFMGFSLARSIRHLTLAPSHLISLSARYNTFGGTVRLICLAVFRLILSSNFVGASTGKSAGFAPLRILSTYTAARRY